MAVTDPLLKYCPVCHDEYRAEIKMCAGCEVELVTGQEFIALQQEGMREKNGRSMELSLDDERVNLRSGSLQNMKQLQLILAQEMIPSLLVGEDENCGKGCCGSVFLLQVRLQDSQEALRILKKEFEQSTSLQEHDLSNADAVFDQEAHMTTCPACGHCFAPSVLVCPDCGLEFG